MPTYRNIHTHEHASLVSVTSVCNQDVYRLQYVDDRESNWREDFMEHWALVRS